MSDTPWVKFYSSDWLGGTSGLTAAERGVYITLCALMYEFNGPIRRDDGRLSRRCGCTKAAFTKILGALIEDRKIIEIGGDDGPHLTNRKCETEISDRAIRSEKARAVAQSRWSAQSGKTQGNQRRKNASASATQCESEPEPDIERDKIINISTRGRAKRPDDDDDRLSPSAFISACEPVDAGHWSWASDAVSGFISEAVAAGWSGDDLIAVARSARSSLGGLPMRSTAYIARCLNQRAEALAPDIAAKPKADEGFAARLLSRRNDE